MTAASSVGVVVGLDLSLACSGVAVWRPDAGFSVCRVRSKPGGGLVADRASRVWDVASRVVGFVPRGALVVVESPAFASVSGKVHERYGLWWLVVCALVRAGCRVVEVAPKTRAKYVTGSGNASKRVVVDAVRACYGVDVVDDNEADAVVLAAIGVRLLGGRVERVVGGWMEDCLGVVRERNGF